MEYMKSRAPQQFLCYAFFLVLSGCASLPVGTPLSGAEEDAVISRFKEMIAGQGQCHCCLDADVSISFKKFVTAGAVSGYLQSKEPSRLRFEGVNPLGMTEIVAGTDGESFYLINVRQKKIYTGQASAEKIRKFVPGEFPLQTSQSWLLGHVPPGSLSISSVSRDSDTEGYWIDVSYEKWQKRGLILFDNREGVVLQNIMLDESGDVAARFTYDYDSASVSNDEGFKVVSAQCIYPRSVVIDENGNGTVRIQFKQIYSDVNFTESDFDMVHPKGFEREVIR